MKCENRLTDKQEIFIQELIKSKTQREAYKIAYPKSINWKEKTIDEAACRMLKNSKVNARYEELRNKVIDKAEKKAIVTAEQILQELSKIAFGNGSDYAKVVEKEFIEPVMDADGNVTDYKTRKYKVVEVEETDNLSDDKKAALSCIKETKFGISVERYDKLKALELLGKHLGMFEKQDDNDKTITIVHNIPRPPKEGVE